MIKTKTFLAVLSLLICNLSVFAQDGLTNSQRKESRVLNDAYQHFVDSAVKDEDGKVVKFEMAFSEFGKKRTFRLEYENDQMVSLTSEEGAKIIFDRNANGEVDGLILPDGSRIEIGGKKNYFSKASFCQANSISKASYSGLAQSALTKSVLDECSDAINLAGAAGTAAAIACGSGSIFCPVALATFAAASAVAVLKCKPSGDENQ